MMRNKSWFPFLLGVLFSSCVISVLFLVLCIFIRSDPPPEQSENINGQETATPIEIGEIDVKKPNHANGDKIFFTSNIDGGYELYSIDIESKTPTVLTDTNAKYMEAVLSPSGHQLVFTVSNLYEYNPKEIFLFSPDSAETMKINVSSDMYSISTPIWSPDESRLAFSTSNLKKENSISSSEIYLVQVDNNNFVSSTRFSNDISDLKWSPSGDTILFQGYYDIFLIDPNNLNIQQLTYADSSRIIIPSYEPTWSPTGDRIAFISSEAEGDFDIFIMNSDGSNKADLSHLETTDHEPDWSPTGRYILFECQKWSLTSTSHTLDDFDVCLIDLKTMTVKNLTKRQGVDRPLGWFPFEDRILFVSERDNSRDFYSMDINGNNLERITNSGMVYSFIWSPDGSSIAFTTWGVGESKTSLYIADVDGSKQDKLLTVEGAIIISGWQPKLP